MEEYGEHPPVGVVAACRTPGRIIPAGRSRFPGQRERPAAIVEKIGTSFRRAVTAFAEDEHVPVVRFAKQDRKIDMMRRYVAAQARTS